MKDFMDLARTLNPLAAVLLEKLNWPDRIDVLWKAISDSAESPFNRVRQYDDSRKTSDDLTASLIEIFFAAISWELLNPFYEKQGSEWEIRCESDHQQHREAQDKVPVVQAQKAIKVWRLLPKFGKNKAFKSENDPTPVYEKSRQILLNKVVEVWSIAESADFAKELMDFVVRVLKTDSEFGPYGGRAVQALKDRTSQASALRLDEGLAAILACNDLRHYSGSSIHDALDTLRFRWVKALSLDRLSFLSAADRILDRSLPKCAEAVLHARERLVMHLMDVAWSFIDHSPKHIMDWDWEGLNPETMLVELAVQCDVRWWESTKREIEEAGISWSSSDPAVRLTIRGRNKEKKFSGPQDKTDLFVISLPPAQMAA